MFDAVEQARVEAIGSRRMSGIAKNLTAMLDDKFHRGKFDDITDRADAPIEDAIALAWCASASPGRRRLRLPKSSSISGVRSSRTRPVVASTGSNI